MPRNGYIIPGGLQSLNEASAPIKGHYANYPAYSPRYNSGGNRAESVLSQARLYIRVPRAVARSASRKGIAKYLRALESTVDATGAPVGGYVDLLVQSIDVSRTERSEVHIDLADSYSVYWFGANPAQGSLSAVLINTRQDDWFDAWLQMWSPILRGTALAARGARLYLWHDTRVYHIDPISESNTINAQQEMTAQISAQFYVRGVTVLPSPWVNAEPTLLDRLQTRAATDRASSLVERARAESSDRSAQQTLIETGALQPVGRDNTLQGPAAFSGVAAAPRPDVSTAAAIAQGGLGLWAV